MEPFTELREKMTSMRVVPAVALAGAGAAYLWYKAGSSTEGAHAKKSVETREVGEGSPVKSSEDPPADSSEEPSLIGRAGFGEQDLSGEQDHCCPICIEPIDEEECMMRW